MTPLKEAWLKLYEPVTQNMKLDMRMNLKSKKVRRAAQLLPASSTSVDLGSRSGTRALLACRWCTVDFI